MRAARCWAGAIALGLMLAATAGCAVGGDKAGGEGGVTTLRLGTADPPGRIGSRQAERFAAEVRRRSEGRLRIRIVYEADASAVGGYKPGWDQTIAALVRDGRLELGMIPARAWDTLGVSSLQALQAPFLITSTELVDEVVRSPLGGQMLSGLDKAGVVGLALLPEELRHPVGFGHDLRGPSDYVGRELRVPRSEASFELMRALGARAVDLSGAVFERAVLSKQVAGAESSFALAGSLPRPGSVSANVTFYPKVNTLVADREAFDALPEEQRNVLREAAVATVAEPAPSEAANAATACRQGAQVIAASAADIAALEAATRPVYAKLEREPLTRSLIARIRALKARTTVADAPAKECRPVARGRAGAAPVAGGDPSVLNGVYRYYLDQDELIRAGMDPGRAVKEYGVQTVTLRDGRLSVAWRSSDNSERCDGSYTVAGDQAEIVSTPCEVHVRFHWRKTGDVLQVTDVASLPPSDAPRDRLVERLVWGSKPWKRVADVAPSRPSTIPDGAYRTAVGRPELVRAGVSEEDMLEEIGIQTLTIKNGRFRHATQTRLRRRGPDCVGRVVPSAQRVSFVLDPGPCGGPEGDELFSAGWALVDGGLRFTDLQTDVLAAGPVFGGRIWKRIG